jgi:hypothetical protein
LVNNLFSALMDGPHKNLFIALVLVRVTAWLALPVLSLWWFASSLNELTRECVAVEALSVEASTPHAPDERTFYE